jgi:hypothetical protein
MTQQVAFVVFVMSKLFVPGLKHDYVLITGAHLQTFQLYIYTIGPNMFENGYLELLLSLRLT